ncbi:(3R)-3-hydroxyacyl-CoA dehydrogenase [Onthophagus taurus]|uniref:(3R)-3-hydroxyacyl-CoA dehydrogenase n=1 Tax=Onthophagus taurus TaxID=166361 RepID=UPI0039BE62EE
MAGIVLGKVAFVTGAASGIGKATCQILAREGAKVIAADRNLIGAKETAASLKNQNDHLGVLVNVNEKETIQDALEKTVEKYREPPSVIVNCAGITRDNFLLKLSEADFNEVIDVNLKGTFLIIQTFANALVDRGIRNGSIVNISSIVGKYGNLGQCNYAASKAGVELLTKTASKEFGKFGIRCNTVLPGFIKTPMTEIIPDKVKSKVISTISIGRFGNVEEVAEVICFLSSDKSSFINGASIEVTGGM